MKKFLQKRKRKGFTLVELLIVIIIIGILAGSMLLVMGAGRDKAEATKIVSNLRSVKAAALMYYADNNNWPTTPSTELVDYMDATVPNTFAVESGSMSGSSFDTFLTFDLTGVDNGVVVKLNDMKDNADVPIYSFASSTADSGDISGKVCMILD